MDAGRTDHEVIIVGAGPVGTMLAIELGRRGIDVLVVERREGRLRHPRATAVHARSMEIFRQLGIADELRAAGGLPVGEWSRFAYLTRLAAPEIGIFDGMGDQRRVAQAHEWSPELWAWCAQDSLEEVLRGRALGQPSVSFGFGLRAAGVEQDADGVRVSVVKEDSGAEQVLTAKYLVGADGGRSAVRTSVGIGSEQTEPLSHQINVCFEADLSEYTAGRNAMIYWIVNPETQGAFLTYDGRKRWVYSWDYDPTANSRESFTTERCTDVVRTAIGVPDVDIHIEGTFFWTVDSAMAGAFGEGRVFLFGDAAHRFPPAGGFGMNTGLQDTQNLGWKLHEVLRGSAGPELLATYGTERRATSLRNRAQTVNNARKSAEVGWIMNDPKVLAGIEQPDGGGIRQRIADAIPGQKEQYWSHGLQFGMVYDSSAVIADGSPLRESTVSDYEPTAHPGAHAPHVWLEDPAGGRVSTVDLLHTRFVALMPTAGRAWAAAARDVGAARGTDIGAFTIGAGGDFTDPAGDWADRYGLGDTGVVVVRPNGHVAFRAAALAAGQSPHAVLDEVFGRLLGTAPGTDH